MLLSVVPKYIALRTLVIKVLHLLLRTPQSKQSAGLQKSLKSRGTREDGALSNQHYSSSSDGTNLPTHRHVVTPQSEFPQFTSLREYSPQYSADVHQSSATNSTAPVEPIHLQLQHQRQQQQ
uniref:Uncharacterized protein n=1 Tax=Lygus hesperus TaxID=30085 RepID=A0A0A9Z356_LYGHE